jgi:hypothetical protein
MAKQTFTTGQVLTAAQMTSLQQTAMGGGEATAKTANYVLTAADAGTTVIMNAAGATTITVNTALFAAGDTVNIQNIGAGICTVTAGTATVNTAGSLALNQYEGGVLYFRSTSAATFFDYVQTGAVSPLTTKGDLYGFSTLDARIPIGTNDQVLIADSAQALGLKWGSAPAPSYTWTTWAPALKQSASVTYTNRGSKYIVVGKLFIGKFILQLTSAGTANNQMFLDFPLTFPAPYNTLALGVVNFYDSSAATSYTGQIIGTGSGSPDILAFESGVNKATPRWGLTGSDCAIALASGDFLSGTVIVELT